jgi:glycerol-3-phosphate acyltransferase PlsY
VATAAGILFGIDALLGLVTVAAWLVTAMLFRISSLAAIVAAVLAPLWYLREGSGWTEIAIVAMSALLLYRHKDNIRRLMAGEEQRLGRPREHG